MSEKNINIFITKGTEAKENPFLTFKMNKKKPPKTIFTLIMWLIKIWFIGLIIFIIFVNLLPKKKPMTNGKIYIGDNKVDESENTLHFFSIEDTIANMEKIEAWIVKNKIQNMVFLVPKYEAISSYIYLKKYGKIDPQKYSIGVISRKIGLKKIIGHYNDLIRTVIDTIFQIVFNRKNKNP